MASPVDLFLPPVSKTCPSRSQLKRISRCLWLPVWHVLYHGGIRPLNSGHCPSRCGGGEREGAGREEGLRGGRRGWKGVGVGHTVAGGRKVQTF